VADDATDVPGEVESADEGLYFDFFRKQIDTRKNYEDYVGKPLYIKDLTRAFESYRRLEQFVVGQLVQWKPLMGNREYPQENAPAVIVELGVSRGPAANGPASASLEREDVLIGFLNGNKIFTIVPTSTMRLTAWDEVSGEFESE